MIGDALNTAASGAGLSIRPARLDDATALAALSTQLGYPCTSTAMQTRLEHILREAIGQIFVACDNQNAVVGWTHVVERTHLEDDAFCEVAGLIVDERKRSTGVGAALLRVAEQWAIENGFAHLRVRSNVLRNRAHAFYRREGYAENKRQVVFDKALTKLPG